MGQSTSRIIQGLIDDIKRGDDQQEPQPFLCKIHKDEQIDLFCKKCKKAVCDICCDMDHRQCKMLVSIEDILPDITANILARKQMLHERIAERKDVITKRSSKMELILQKTAKTASDIKTASGNIIEIIRTKESKLMQKLEAIKNDQILQLKAELNSDIIAIHEYQQQSHIIDQAVKSNSQKDLFDMFELCEVETKDEDVNVIPEDRVVFKCDPDGLKKSVEEIHLGQVYSIKAGDIGRQSSPVLLQTIDTSTLYDSRSPDITDAIVMEVDGDKLIVLTDSKNKSVKSFNIDGKQQLRSVQKMEAEPFGVTAVGSNEILVTLPFCRVMVRLSVVPTMKRLSLLRTMNHYRGVDRLDQNRLVACRNPPFGKSVVDIIDVNGEVLKSFDIGSTNKVIYASVTEKRNIRVSDRIAQEVIFISPEESGPSLYVSTKYFGINRPRGIASTSTGDILLVGMDVNKVIQVNESGDFVRDILTSADGLTKPRGICIDKDGLVYVTCGKYIKVYMFK